MNNDFNIESIDYLYIFDYYDIPLSFITQKLNNKYYFFYYIDCNSFFIKPLNATNLNLIFSKTNSTREILQKFYEESDFFILQKQDDKIVKHNIQNFERENNIKLDKFFPEDGYQFEYDFISGKSFDVLCDEYITTFSDVLNLDKQLTIKLIDSNNSHSADLDVVTKAINLVNNFIEGSKSYLNEQNIFTKSKLVIIPFTPGSFNINFKLVQSGEATLCNDGVELNFNDFISLIDSIQSQDAYEVYKNIIFENKKIVKSLSEFYHLIKERKISVSLEEDNNKLSDFVINEQTDKFINNLYLLAYKQDNLEEITEIIDFEGIINSASNTRNVVSINTVSGIVKAKFSKELFGQIKIMGRSVSISSKVRGQWLKQTFLDETNNIIDEKYEIVDFTQNI